MCVREYCFWCWALRQTHAMHRDMGLYGMIGYWANLNGIMVLDSPLDLGHHVPQQSALMYFMDHMADPLEAALEHVAQEMEAEVEAAVETIGVEEVTEAI